MDEIDKSVLKLWSDQGKSKYRDSFRYTYIYDIYIYIIIYVVACRDIVKSDILLNIYFMSAK